jgi:hypothetical protein
MKYLIFLRIPLLLTAAFIVGCNDKGADTMDLVDITPKSEGTEPTNEDDLSVPAQPFSAKRITHVEMEITVPNAYDGSASIEYFGQNAAARFDPTQDKSFRVSDIKVIDADNTERNLAIDFVIGQSSGAIEHRVLGYFLSIDGTALNVMKKNDAQTAFYLKSGRCESTSYESSFILNHSHLTTNEMPATLNLWYGGCLKYVSGETKRNPATTATPSYVAEQGGGATRDTSLANYSQPLATVGYPQYANFLVKDFTLLSNFNSLTDAEKNSAALEETRRVLIDEKNNNGADIGWYGIAKDDRNNISRRFHIIQLEITLDKDDNENSGTTITIKQNTLKVANYNVEDTPTPEIIPANVNNDIILNNNTHP